MKICVFGAGAVGGHLAARLDRGGAEVSLLARGPHLAAIRANGLRVETTEGVLHFNPAASDDPSALGAPDLVIVTVKSPSLPQVAANISPLLGRDTPVVFVMNGVPWWYFYQDNGPLEGTRLPKIDPGGTVWNAVGPKRAIGAVAHTACTVVAPGVIRAANPRNRIILGRPDGTTDPLLSTIADVMKSGGLEVSVTDRIRNAIWEKLLMNLVGGSIGILTASPMGEALSNPAVAAAAARIAREGASIAAALGADAGDPEAALSRLSVSTHKQSLLQDLEAGRSMEIDGLLATPLELAGIANVETPTLELVVGLAIQRARAAGLYVG